VKRRTAPKEAKNLNLGDVRVSIHLPTLNEEEWIRSSLESLRDQPLYRKSEQVKIVVLDSHSTDNTVAIAEEHADRVLTVPRGKLNARHAGIGWDEADIIVSADADCEYPRGWLSHLLEPFSDPSVVATHGAAVSEGFVWSPLRAWATGVGFYRRIFSARNSAFRRGAYFGCGGFDLSVDQFDRDGELNQEEERRFKEKLEEVGEVRYVDIAVSTSERQMPLVLGDGAVKKYRKERERGIRF